MPRVGVEVLVAEGAGDPNVLPDTEKARAKRQKELLKKKRAERRAHARQRAEKAQLEHEQEKFTGDNGEQELPKEESVNVEELTRDNGKSLATETNTNNELPLVRRPESHLVVSADTNGEVEPPDELSQIAAAQEQSSQHVEEKGDMEFEDEVGSGVNDQTAKSPQREETALEIVHTRLEAHAVADVESNSTMTTITASATSIGPDASPELVPKTKGKRKKKVNKSNANAAAATIQQALKKNLIKCKSLVRHSSKVFAADEVADYPPGETGPALAQTAEPVSGRMSMERLFPKLPSSNKIQPMLMVADDVLASNESKDVGVIIAGSDPHQSFAEKGFPKQAKVAKEEHQQIIPQNPIVRPDKLDTTSTLETGEDMEKPVNVSAASATSVNNDQSKRPDLLVREDSTPVQQRPRQKRASPSSRALATPRSNSSSPSRSSASYTSSASSSCSCSSSASCSSSDSEDDKANSRSSRKTRHAKQQTPTKDGPRATVVNQEAMAVRIQAHIRGMFGRKRARLQREEIDAQLRAEAEQELEHDASVLIQARTRGYLTRQSLKSKRKRKRAADDSEPSIESTMAAKGLSNTPGSPSSYTKQAEVDDDKTGVWPEELNLEVQDNWEELGEVASTSGERVTHERFLSRGLLRVFCGTWNMHAKKPADDDLRLWILRNKYHIVAIGTEECVNSIAKSVVFTSKKSWEKQLTDALGNEYSLVASHALTAIHHAVFVHESVMPMLSHVQSDAVATGLGNQLGNKGGVGVSLCIGSTSLLFVNCHFEAHQRNIERRNANFHRINQELKLFPPVVASSGDTAGRTGSITASMARKSMPPAGASATGISGNSRRSVTGAAPANAAANAAIKRLPASDRFDRVFWFGDLNYRVNGTRRMVDLLLLHDQHAVLRFNDQLSVEMARGRVFPHFREGPLHFRPTYKFDKRSAVYDSSPKQRIPSWTDRVVFRSNGKLDDLRVLSYRSHMSFQSSDHRPVGAVFEVAFVHPGSSLPTSIAAKPAEQQPTQQKQRLDSPVENEFGRVVAKGYRASQSKSEVCCLQ